MAERATPSCKRPSRLQKNVGGTGEKYRGKAKVAASKAATSTNDSQSESSPSGKMEVLYCILLMFVLMIILYYVDC